MEQHLLSPITANQRRTDTVLSPLFPDSSAESHRGLFLAQSSPHRLSLCEMTRWAYDIGPDGTGQIGQIDMCDRLQKSAETCFRRGNR
jgi:hypothetical protein